jgi:NADPH:quinone reductase-like Zn-dependent oxidoreductase
VVEEIGAGVEGFKVGEDVLGWSDDRAAHAELVSVPATQLTRKPPELSWEAAGSLFVTGSTAWAALRAVRVGDGDVLVVSAAAGGVGSILVQLAVRAGAKVIGLAGPANHAWLREQGVTPVEHGDGLADRLRAVAPRIDAFIDLFGDGYVDLALELGVPAERIDTIADVEAARRHGVRTDGNRAGARIEVVAELADLVAAGELEIPIAETYPLDRVRDAFRDVAERHTRGKRVLIP